jgi:hypothetical protein
MNHVAIAMPSREAFIAKLADLQARGSSSTCGSITA